MKEETRSALRQVPWLGVGIILLAGVLISAGIVWSRMPEKPQDPPAETGGSVCTVTFVDENGSLLEEQQVPAGGYAVPPALESVNDAVVFRQWNNRLYDVTRSVELAPVYQDLQGEKNVFWLDSQYAQLGEEVQTDLWLGGQVCLSGMELAVTYDPEVLEDFRCDVTGSPFTVAESKKGIITLRLEAEENLTEGISVARISFTVADDRADVARTTVRIEMKDPEMIRSGAVAGTDSNAVHGDIYILS